MRKFTWLCRWCFVTNYDFVSVCPNCKNTKS
jgi:rubrerythrin